jgi:tetratricopeptide (TPR) repeat protein
MNLCIDRLVLMGCTVALLNACSVAPEQPVSGQLLGQSGAVNAAVKEQYDPQFAAAVAAMQGEDWEAAERLLTDLNSQYTQATGVLINLGIVYKNTQRPVEAEAMFRESLAIEASIDSYNLLAVSLREQGRFAESLKVYQAALEAYPDDGETHRNVGILYDLYLGDAARALVHYQAFQATRDDTDDQVAAWVYDLENYNLENNDLENRGKPLMAVSESYDGM